MEGLKTFRFFGKPNALWHLVEPSTRGIIDELVHGRDLPDAKGELMRTLRERKEGNERTKGMPLAIKPDLCRIYEILPDGTQRRANAPLPFVTSN